MLAVFVIGSQTDSFGEIGVMTILATALLAALVFHSLFTRNYFGIFLPFAFLYMIYSEPLELIYISPWLLVITAMLLSIGFSILFSSYHSKVVCLNKGHIHHENDREDMDDNNPYAKVNFGSSSKYLHADCLKTARFVVSFGALQVYFDQAQLSPDGAEIVLDCSFGAIELFVPKHWRVLESINTTLAGVENNTRYSSSIENAPVLTIKGNVQFGGIEIKYI